MSPLCNKIYYRNNKEPGNKKETKTQSALLQVENMLNKRNNISLPTGGA